MKKILMPGYFWSSLSFLLFLKHKNNSISMSNNLNNSNNTPNNNSNNNRTL